MADIELNNAIKFMTNKQLIYVLKISESKYTRMKAREWLGKNHLDKFIGKHNETRYMYCYWRLLFQPSVWE